MWEIWRKVQDYQRTVYARVAIIEDETVAREAAKMLVDNDTAGFEYILRSPDFVDTYITKEEKE